MPPLVSVLIDTYNHERFIEQAILSVLEQDVPSADMEILVVDDGSTDRTPDIVRKFAPRVRHLRKANGGQASAFNVGIPETRAAIVAMLDGDDWWRQDKLRQVLDTFAENPDVGMVGHGFVTTDSSGAVQRQVVPDRLYRLDLSSVESARLFDMLKSFFGTSKVAYRRSVLGQILPVPEELVFEADEYLWTLGLALSDGIVLDQPLFYYRMHDSNLYMSSLESDAGTRRRYSVMNCLCRELPPRLATLGIEPEVVDAALACMRLDTELLRLRTEGGWPWEMFRVERALAAYYGSTRFGYRAFKACSLILTLLMPPKTYCRLKSWYSKSSVRHYRGALGDPVSRLPVHERSAVT